MIDERFIFLGLSLSIIGSSNYLFNTLKGKTKPNKVTWLLWTTVPFIALFAQIQQGVGLSALLTFIVGFNPLLIFIASFVNKKAKWNITKLDIICGILSVGGIVLWLTTQTGNIAIFFSILADGLASIPTITKSYRAPETESPLIFLLGGMNGFITLLTL